MAAEARRQNNERSGHDLAIEALEYIADKISSVRNDSEQFRVNNELIRNGLQVSEEEMRNKARRLREISQMPRTEPPPPEDRKGRDRWILEDAAKKDEVKSMKGLICASLKIYGSDLSETRQDIPTQVIIRKPNPEQLDTFLRMQDVDKQLLFIDYLITKIYCE